MQEAEVTQNHENEQARSIGQGGEGNGKCKRFKLSGGKA
jgi:hypothetical protein